MGKQTQLKGAHGPSLLLFSYAGSSVARGSLSIKMEHWSPKPTRLVVVGATVKYGATTVTLSLDHKSNIKATIAFGGQTSNLTEGVKKVGGTSVTVTSATLSARVDTPTLSVAAQQVGYSFYFADCLPMACPVATCSFFIKE